MRPEGGPGLESTDESNGKSEGGGSVAGWGRNLMASLSQWSVSQGTGEGVYEDV